MEKLGQKEISDIQYLNPIIKKTADKTLKTTYRRMKSMDQDSTLEQPEMNDSTINGIKKRKKFNRLRRNAKLDLDKQMFF